jgi:hypothetical protein
MTWRQSSAIIRWRRPKKTPKICRMGARRFLNEILVISPILLIAGITVNARTRVETYSPVQYSNSLNRQIAAYIEPVRLVEEACANGSHMASPPRVRQIGITWRNMTRQGTLVPLHPEHADDSSREGIKSQVRQAADELASALLYCAHRSLREGKPFQAAEDAMLAVEAVQGVKYSDLFALGLFAVRENASLVVLNQALPMLSQSERLNIAQRLEAVKEQAKPLANIVIATHRAQRKGMEDFPPLARPHFELALELAKNFETDDNSARFRQLYGELGRVTLVRESDNFLPEFRFALHAARTVRRDWTKVAQKLG